MSIDDWDQPDESTYAQGRVPERTYASAEFVFNRPNSSDRGQPARFIYKVFDNDVETIVQQVGSEWVICESEKGRYQFKLLVTREAGNVKELWVQRVPSKGSGGTVKCLLNLRQPEVSRLVELLRHLDYIPVEGGETVRIDDALMKDLFASPSSLISLYRRDPQQLRQLIANDEAARDVIAISHRRSQVKKFRRLLCDSRFFDSEVMEAPGARPEAVWQRFFEDNPWILGVSLGGQLLTSWSSQKLEQVVAGSSIAGAGKRADALLRTSGRVSSLVFAEIKTHRAHLLVNRDYRPGCWPVSADVTGGVAQAQGTVHRAVREIGDRLQDTDSDGTDVPGKFAYLVHPKSYLIIGSLAEMIGDSGGDHPDKIRSFELYRRQLVEPEIVTFDELLARAEWYTQAD